LPEIVATSTDIILKHPMLPWFGVLFNLGLGTVKIFSQQYP
jgi:uncharacterized membrane protein